MDDPEVKARPSFERDAVFVDCPYCGGVHTHGWPEPETTRDHRLSHCVTKDGGGYWIIKEQ